MEYQHSEDKENLAGNNPEAEELPLLGPKTDYIFKQPFVQPEVEGQ